MTSGTAEPMFVSGTADRGSHKLGNRDGDDRYRSILLRTTRINRELRIAIGAISIDEGGETVLRPPERSDRRASAIRRRSSSPTIVADVLPLSDYVQGPGMSGEDGPPDPWSCSALASWTMGSNAAAPHRSCSLHDIQLLAE